MTTFDKLNEELSPYKNTLIIADFFNIARLVDVVEDEEDYYWVYDTWKKGTTKASCCGKWYPLKGHMPKEEYDRLLKEWNLNNIEKAE